MSIKTLMKICIFTLISCKSMSHSNERAWYLPLQNPSWMCTPCMWMLISTARRPVIVSTAFLTFMPVFSFEICGYVAAVINNDNEQIYSALFFANLDFNAFGQIFSPKKLCKTARKNRRSCRRHRRSQPLPNGDRRHNIVGK